MPRLRSFPGLRSTLSDLRRYRRQWDSLMAAAAPQPVAAPAHLAEIADFGANPGNLRMLAHLPPSLPRGAPLVVALHGCTQTAAAFDHGTGWSALADAAGFAVLLPEQRRANNPQLCFNWFHPADIARDQGELASIRAMIGHMVDTYGLDPRRIHVTGLSAGGAMAAALLAVCPDVFAAGAIIAGLPYGCAGNAHEALDCMRHGHPQSAETLGARVRAVSAYRGPWPAVQIWQGLADRTVAPVNAQELVKQWTDLHGLKPVPAEEERIGPHSRLIWRDKDGRNVVEYYAIAGMDHGVPVIAAAGPYMLPAGISATDRIAAGWGLMAHNPGVRRGA